MTIIPTVYEGSGRSEKSLDIYSRLLRDRIILLNTEIDDDSAANVVAQLLYLQLEDPKKDISMYIMSPGGSIYSCLAIYDAMQRISCDINTYCLGYAMSAGSVLLAAGTPGKRIALENSTVMMHQPWGGAFGDTEQMSRAVGEISRLRDLIYGILAKHTGRTAEQLKKDCDRDMFLSAKEAVEYGVVDKVMPSFKLGKK